MDCTMSVTAECDDYDGNFDQKILRQLNNPTQTSKEDLYAKKEKVVT